MENKENKENPKTRVSRIKRTGQICSNNALKTEGVMSRTRKGFMLYPRHAALAFSLNPMDFQEIFIALCDFQWNGVYHDLKLNDPNAQAFYESKLAEIRKNANISYSQMLNKERKPQAPKNPFIEKPITYSKRTAEDFVKAENTLAGSLENEDLQEELNNYSTLYNSYKGKKDSEREYSEGIRLYNEILKNNGDYNSVARHLSVMGNGSSIIERLKTFNGFPHIDDRISYENFVKTYKGSYDLIDFINDNKE